MDKNNSNKFSAVTTFNLERHPYGIEMINSFFLNWPDEIQLTAYVENSLSLDDSTVKDKIIVKEFHDEIPEYLEFCKKYSHQKKHTDDFRFNVFRFAHKVYAILRSLQNINSRYLIWLDSDIKTHKKIPIDFFNCLINETTYMSYLGREKISIEHLSYSECGFLIFDTHHSIHKIFWENMIDMYSGGKLFKEKEWHDSYIFDQVRKKLEKKNNIKNFNICNLGLIDIEEGNNEHVFVTSVLGKYMDHKKGNRKDVKWSPELIKRVKKDQSHST